MTPGEDESLDVGEIDAQLVRKIMLSTRALAESVDNLTNTQAGQINTVTALARRTRVILRWALAGLALDLMLTLGGVFLFHRVDDNSGRIERLQSSTNAGFCAHSDLFLDSYNLAGPSAKADQAAYQASFIQLERAARAAGCDHVVRGRN